MRIKAYSYKRKGKMVRVKAHNRPKMRTTKRRKRR